MASTPQAAPAVDVEYLKLIQGVVDRLAQNSFHAKSWSVGMAAAILTVGTISQRSQASVLAFFPAICFCLLDAYYLRRERLFRALYDAAVRADAPRFCLDTRPFEGPATSWGSVLRSPAILLAHIPIVAVIALVIATSLILNLMKGAG